MAALVAGGDRQDRERDGVTPRELARSLNSRRASFLDQLASVLGKSDRLAELQLFRGNTGLLAAGCSRATIA